MKLTFERFQQFTAENNEQFIAQVREKLDCATDPDLIARLRVVIERLAARSLPVAMERAWLYARIRQWNKHPHRKLKPMEN